MAERRYTRPMELSRFKEMQYHIPNIVEIRDWIDFLANFCDRNDGCPVESSKSGDEIWNDEPCPFYDECHDDCFIKERIGSAPRNWKATGGLMSDIAYEDSEDFGYWVTLGEEKKKRNVYYLTKTVMYETTVTGVSGYDAQLRAEAYDWVNRIIVLRPWTVEEEILDKEETEDE